MKKIGKPRLPGKLGKKQSPKHERITNETVAEHREKILAGGRKFKYPVQYAQHKLIINTLIIGFLAVGVLIGVTWWQLYITQNTGAFFYRLTQLVPLRVATIDGQRVHYRDYLMQYRSSIHWIESKAQSGPASNNSDNSKRQANHFKRQSLDRAIENAYAQKIADKKNIVIPEEEIDKFIESAVQASTNSRKPSEEAYKAVLSDSLGVSADEYRLIVKQALLKQKVSFAIDTAAKRKINAAYTALKHNEPFEDVVIKYSDDSFAKITKGDVGFVPRSNQDQGLVQAATKLEKDTVSDIIKGSDGYYIVRLIELKEDQVHYARIKVELTAFNSQLSSLKKQGKLQEYIKVETNNN
jgi:hypothetical protein